MNLSSVNFFSMTQRAILKPRFFWFLFVLAPFSSNYVFLSQISIGDSLFFVFLFLLLVNVKLSLSNLIALGLALSLIVISFIVFSVNDDFRYLWQFTRLSFYYFSFFLIVSQKSTDFSDFFKVYRVLSLFFSVSIILQWFLYHAFGVSYPFQFPIPVYESDTLIEISHVYRSGGFFKEPSYYAIFICPLLFYIAHTRRLFDFFVISVAGVLSTSTLFIFILFLSVFFFPRVVLFVILFVFSLVIILAAVFVDGLVDNFIVVARLISIFIDGGTLNDRFIPALTLLESSGFFYSRNAFTYLYSSGYWFSSLGTTVAGLGSLCLLYLCLSFFRLGLFFGAVVFVFLLTTHFMSSVYSAFVFYAFFAFNSLRKEKIL